MTNKLIEDFKMKQQEIEKMKNLEKNFSVEESAPTTNLNDQYPTLNNYNKEDFDIEGPVLKHYEGSGFGTLKIKIPFGITTILDDAFKNCLADEIMIPESVQWMGARIFLGCNEISSITIPKSVKWMKCSTFLDSSITSIKFTGTKAEWNAIQKGDESIPCPSGYLEVNTTDGKIEETLLSLPTAKVENYSTEDFEIEGTVLKHFKGVRNVWSRIPLGVTSIGEKAFYGCKHPVFVIEIPKGVKTIEDSAFEKCYPPLKLYIPDSIESIGTCSFNFEDHDREYKLYINIPSGVKSINGNLLGDTTSVYLTIDDHNLKYYIEKNCLIERERKRVIATFGFCEIPVDCHIESIGSKAFYSCKNMFIEVPKSVKLIDTDAFRVGCNISYAGTMAEWRMISKGKLHSGKVICKDGVIDINSGEEK